MRVTQRKRGRLSISQKADVFPEVYPNKWRGEIYPEKSMARTDPTRRLKRGVYKKAFQRELTKILDPKKN